MSRADAEKFYAVHKARPFFKSLCDFMTSGPIVAQRAVPVLDGDTEESLHERIKVVERRLIVDVVRDFCRDAITYPQDA